MGKTSDLQCEVCGRKADDGVALYRTSPKGGPFAGVCSEHRLFPVDEPNVAGIIERANRSGAGG